MGVFALLRYLMKKDRPLIQYGAIVDDYKFARDPLKLEVHIVRTSDYRAYISNNWGPHVEARCGEKLQPGSFSSMVRQDERVCGICSDLRG